MLPVKVSSYWSRLTVDDGTVEQQLAPDRFSGGFACKAVTSPLATFVGLHSCSVYRETSQHLVSQSVGLEG